MERNFNYWFLAKDAEYYKNFYATNCLVMELLKLDEKGTHKIALLPDEKLIKDLLFYNETSVVISNELPPLKYRNLFIIKNLPNKHGLLPSQAKIAGISEAQMLEIELGLSVIDSPFTLNDVGGAKPLKDFTKQLVNAEKHGYQAKGIFLVGIPGTGKTFFPKCFAGELKRKLIMLNLSQILESDEPIGKLNEIFEYLDNRCKYFPNEKFVVLIDEIEKMIGSSVEPKQKQMLGRLLTVLNDIHTPACEYKFNAIFFATANDLASILSNNPEFLRRGRWDELFFISLPTSEYAKEMFELYIKKFKIAFILEIMLLDELFAEIEDKYQKENPLSNKFPYTPAEIENFCKRIDFLKKAKGDEFSRDDIINCIEMIIPLAKSAKDGINKMAGQKELFIEI